MTLQMLKIKKVLQPAGFFCLLAYLALGSGFYAMLLFWVGVLLTVGGTFTEVQDFLNVPPGKRPQSTWMFALGFFVKLFLIIALALRIYEVRYSFFILLFSIALAFVWFVLSAVVVHHPQNKEDWLDIE